MDGILGPISTEPTYFKEDFTYDDVTTIGSDGKIVKECHGRVCTKLCEYIDNVTLCDRGTKNYFCICIPCYNESMDDLMKTVLCLMENIDFMKHEVKFHCDEVGQSLKREIQEMEIVICPVFDGMGPNQMDSSIRKWLAGDMPGCLEGLPGGKNNNTSSTGLRGREVEVRVCAQRWWYYCLTNQEGKDEGDTQAIRRMAAEGLLTSDHQLTGDMYLHFHMVPILKRSNHRKHNSHHWFFEGICCGLDTNLVLLTDCSTSYKTSCIARLVHTLLSRRSDVIAVTGRMRAELPSRSFHPCMNTKIPFLQHAGEHDGRASAPCWKCYAAYFLSVAPVQGFEMEACQIINSSVYNVVEAMPVLPGPCQLMNWPRIREYKVVEEYFEMLFNEDTVKFGAVRSHKRLLPDIYMDSAYALELEPDIEDANISPLTNGDLSMRSAASRPSRRSSVSVSYAEIYGKESVHDWDKVREYGWQEARRPRGLTLHSAAAALPAVDDSTVDPKTVKLTFTEFLRLHLRLAEDRILSFVSIFCTGYGTKCVQDAIFYYEPEVSFDMILKQRRRWVNGTVAGFFFFIFSRRAMLHIEGGFFDAHKAGKNLPLVILLWCLNMIQFLFCFVSPAVLGISFYNSLQVMIPSLHGTFLNLQYDDTIYLSHAGVLTSLYLFIYTSWCYHSYYMHPSETYASYIFVVGFVVTIFVWMALFSSSTVGFVHVVAAFVVVGPFVLALTQTLESAILYVLYLPWFVLFSGFYLIFLPAYAFSRLWDTTWGNRLTGQDATLSNIKTTILKRRVMWFNIFLVLANIMLTIAGCLYLSDETTKTVLILVLFIPTFIQFTGSIIYIILGPLLRLYFGPRSKTEDVLREVFRPSVMPSGGNFPKTTIVTPKSETLRRRGF